MAYVEYEADGKTIKARVQQKTDTLANWMANDNIVLAGEQAFVVNDDGTPLNFKIGDGTKPFRDLPNWIDFSNAQRVSSVAPGVVPAGPAEETRYMEVTAIGTYTYGGNTLATITEDGYKATLWWTGTEWISNGSVRVKGDDGDTPTGTNEIVEDEVPNGIAVIKYSAKREDLDSILKPDTNQAITLFENKSIRKTDGESVSTTGWLHSDFLPVESKSTVTRIGHMITTGGSPTVAIIAFYDENKEYLGAVDQTGISIPATFSFVVNTYYPNAKYVICCSNIATGLQVKIKGNLEADLITGLPSVISKNPTLFRTIDFATSATVGFYDATGAFITSGATNWRATQVVNVSPGQVVTYKGITSANVMAIVGWKANGDVVVIAGVVNLANETNYTVPADVVRVAGSARMIGGDSFVFRMNLPVSSLNETRLSNIENGDVYKSFMPTKTYAVQGQRLTINPKGILSKLYTDVFWSLQNSNQEYFTITPSNTNDIDVELKYRNAFENIRSCGKTTLKVSPPVAVNPSSNHYFLTIGDSTTLGVSASGIEGAWANECSRRLTGVGTPLLSGSESPAPLSLSSIKFIGTIGNEPIKCEGRGGWGYQHYLNSASISGVTNAFYNPTTSKFDLDYYISQNGFTGINSTGSNLTIFIQLGWNHVYSATLTQVEAWANELLGLIHTARPDTKVVFLGLATPPELNEKEFTGSRNVSFESIMLEAIIPYAELYSKLSAQNSSYIEYLHVASQFFSEKSYPSADVVKTIRNSDTIKVYTDYVHPNGRGYAQIADCVMGYILYNYCR